MKQLHELLEEYKGAMKLSGRLRPVTQENYRAAVLRFVRWIGGRPVLADLTEGNLYRFFNQYIDKRQPNVARVLMCAIKHFCAWLIEKKWLSGSPMATMALPQQEKKRRDPVPDSLVTDMMTAAERLSGGNVRRALAKGILAVLTFAGLRRSEICSLNVDDVQFEKRRIHVREGKGGKEGYVYPCAECFTDVREYLKVRPESTCLALFLNQRRQRLQHRSLYILLDSLKMASGHENEEATPHQFRHGYATRLLNNGADLAAIQANMRHGDALTTMLYLHPDPTGDVQKRAAHLGSMRPAPAEPAPDVQTGKKKADPAPSTRSRRIPRGDR